MRMIPPSPARSLSMSICVSISPKPCKDPSAVTLASLKTRSFRRGQRQRTRGERLKTGNSNKFNKTLAQLLIDAKGGGLHWLGGLARTGFISNKTMG